MNGAITIEFKTLFFYIGIVCCFFANENKVYGQELEKEIVANAGGTFSNKSMQLEWTLGELVVDSYKNQALQISTGFHPKNKDEVSTSLKYEFEEPDMTIYPNPANEKLFVKLEGLTHTEFLIYNVLGHIVERGTIVSNKEIDLQYHHSGVYYLQLQNSSRDTQLFVKR